MDFIIDSLKDLSSSLTAGQFLIILLIIALVSGGFIFFFIKNFRKPNSLFAFLRVEDEDADITDIQEQIEFLSSKIDNVIREVKEVVSDALADRRVIDSEVKYELEKTSALKDDIQQMYIRLTSSLDDIKTVIKLQNSHDQHAADNVKLLLQQSLDAIRSTQAHLVKLDDYIRDQVPQFRSDNKEFAKDLNDLSRDLALIERSIQTQVSTIRAVTLRQ